MDKTLLENYSDFFNKFGFLTELRPELLVVRLGKDREKREWLLSLQRDEGVVVNPLGPGGVKEAYVQLTLLLPCPVKPSTIGETCRLLMFINKSLPFPGFIFDEAAERIVFRYALLEPSGGFDETAIISIAGIILMTLESFSDTIDTVAAGTSMKEAIEEKIAVLVKNK